MEKYKILIIILLILILSGCTKEGERTSPAPPQPQPAETPATPETSGGGISFSEDARIVPGPPGNIRVSSKGGKTVIEWQGTRDDRVTAYAVYRSPEAEAAWQLIGRVPASDGNSGLHSFSEPVKTGFRYAISAIDARGTEGPKQVVGSGN